MSNEKENINLNTVLDEEPIKKKKRISLWKVLVFAFIGLNLLALVGMYNTYVVQAPSHLKEARKYFATALYFATYEMFFLKIVRLDYSNPFLTPLHKVKRYFYDIGIEKLPQTEGERAVWYEQVIYYPINYSYNIERDKSLANKYGKEFANKIIDDIYDNLFIFANYEISDFDNPNKRIQDRVAWGNDNLYMQYFREYHNAKLINSMDELLSDRNKLQKLFDVYQFRKKFYNNPKYQNIIKELNIDEKTKQRNIYYIGNLFQNFQIVSYMIRAKYKDETLNCKNDSELINDYLIYLNDLKKELKVTNIVEHEKKLYAEHANDGWMKPMLNKKCFKNQLQGN